VNLVQKNLGHLYNTANIMDKFALIIKPTPLQCIVVSAIFGGMLVGLIMEMLFRIKRLFCVYGLF
jgi:hypothetical protein